MILGQIAYVDCLVFLIFLIPQLLLRVNFFQLITVAIEALPFFSTPTITNICGNSSPPSANVFAVIKLPHQYFNERFFVEKSKRSPFVQQATPFEDFIIRIVRYVNPSTSSSQ